jgi:hypothetical protein
MYIPWLIAGHPHFRWQIQQPQTSNCVISCDVNDNMICHLNVTDRRRGGSNRLNIEQGVIGTEPDIGQLSNSIFLQNDNSTDLALLGYF